MDRLTFIGQLGAVVQRLDDLGEELAKAKLRDHVAQVHD
jgi:hypothetical protein